MNFLNGGADDLEVECSVTSGRFCQPEGIDLQLLGIGTNGHIGFNEPASALVARTHKVVLKAETRRNNEALFKLRRQARVRAKPSRSARPR